MSEVEHPIRSDGSPVPDLPDTEHPFDEPPPDPDIQYGNPERISMMERIAARADAERMGLPLPPLHDEASEEVDTDGAASRQPMHEPPPAREQPQLPAEVANDPLADHFTMVNGQPMMKARIDGVDTLIPFEKVQRVVQKNEAADKRLQDATLWNDELGRREAEIRRREAALESRIQSPGSERRDPPPAPTSDVDDRDLRAQAREVTSSLFKGDEDTAVERLVSLVRQTRSAPALTVDPDEIARKAATEARRQMTAETEAERKARYEQDVRSGFDQFKKDYPDIVADKRLFAVTDSITEDVEKAHPDWTPAQVMTEAGRQTREWAGLAAAPQPTLPVKDDLGDRQERKQELRRMPRARTATRTVEPPAKDEAPSDVIAAMRKARGQPV